MSATCSFVDTEVLSAYVDRELDHAATDHIEAHLGECDHCRQRLASLSNVSSGLRGLERMAPPPVLEELVLGQLEVGAARKWSRRLDEFAAPAQPTRGTIGPMFALVMMLVLLVFLFGEALERSQNQPVVISLPPTPAPQYIHLASGDRFVAVGGAPWNEFATAMNAERVFVEASVAEHFALSHGPGGATGMLLVSELPACEPATDEEIKGLAALRDAAALEVPAASVLALVRSSEELRCLVL